MLRDIHFASIDSRDSNTQKVGAFMDQVFNCLCGVYLYVVVFSSFERDAVYIIYSYNNAYQNLLYLLHSGVVFSRLLKAREVLLSAASPPNVSSQLLYSTRMQGRYEIHVICNNNSFVFLF